ncbi:MAG: 3-deoxy-7-phosphoheptulonate synthase [Fimbriimonadales bacterium]|jgi:3-deoxy-7-phosphoheptulonate synthase|nr:3-deoxy-7-phosphoheptulonate synthase [Fimbriimonadales bacterium]CUU10047.1 3-deoxy-D-arabinoheptulosonate-7-phosphate synthase [Armatimonadetes bacterium GBS]CUU34761.1 3-deoxy-D-arabinoheptulosonate-7-phosphate synthase [Armatimonadetes bacterium GXS]CUU35249.1 3-deoxy-D-arabinoheptulosonate-7-phosphate synthase [Armatimonadetes bacterium DC]GBC90764.1 Phospho-2-dehydro-3-deoxyheptonate aldolase [bacterium HR14]
MIVVMQPGATPEQIRDVEERIRQFGFDIHPIYGVERTVIAAVGAPELDRNEAKEQLESLPYVEQVTLVLKPYKFVSKKFREQTVVRVGGVEVGGTHFAVMAGPCTVENEEQLFKTAQAVQQAGAHILRGGAYKPSTSPYSFHGLGREGLELLARARELTGMPIITEVMDPRNVELVCQYADILQIGTRNMQNYDLLREVGQARKPVMLKRGMWATYEEWLQAAEYIWLGGNEQIILCERGIRTFETYTRNTLDINAVPAIKELSHLPIVVDPSHGTGRASLVPAATLAALAAGADGVIVEVHPTPARALKDGAQSLTLEAFRDLMRSLRPLAEVMGRQL